MFKPSAYGGKRRRRRVVRGKGFFDIIKKVGSRLGDIGLDIGGKVAVPILEKALKAKLGLGRKRRAKKRTGAARYGGLMPRLGTRPRGSIIYPSLLSGMGMLTGARRRKRRVGASKTGARRVRRGRGAIGHVIGSVLGGLLPF